jgi:hypothetical protein
MHTAPPATIAHHCPRVTAALNRLVAGIVLGSCLAVLGVAAWLDPSPAGHGTHTQLGMAPCGLLLTTGVPCMTCGMTTAFAHAADGNLVASFRTQPAGALLAIVAAMTALLSGWALWTGSSLAPIGQALWRAPVVITAIAVLLIAWAYTMALALLI